MKQERTTAQDTLDPLSRKPRESSPRVEQKTYPLDAIIVRHSHLDYSWYRRRQSSQIREAELLDDIVEAVKAKKIGTFTIEQAVAGSEYIRDLRREKGKQFKKLCREGRFEMIGSQIQQEVFLSGEEAFFWNVNIGHDTWDQLGGRSSRAFYQPDTFGVPRSFAKMLRHAGYDNFIYTRGHGEEVKTLGAVFHLTSDDGSSVLAVPMPDGYGSFNKLGRWRYNEKEKRIENISTQPTLWKDAAAKQIERMLDKYLSRFTSIGLHSMLLGGGSDFEDVDLDLPRIVAGAQEVLHEQYPNVSFRFGTFEEYVDQVKQTISPDELHSFMGELRSGYEQNVLRGIDSARMYLKQQVDRTERKIADADTLLALSILKQKYTPIMKPAHDLSLLVNTMRKAKEVLLPVYSHDSISGCGTDDAASDMVARVDDVYDYASQVVRNSLRNLSSGKDNYSIYPRYGSAISVVNTLGYSRKSLVEIPLREKLWEATHALIATIDGKHIPVQVVERDGKKVAIAVLELGAYEAKQIQLSDTGQQVLQEKRESQPVMENQFYKVEVLPNGAVKIFDKRAGTYSFSHVFEDVADTGDEYNFNPLAGATPITNPANQAQVRVVSQGPVVTELEIKMDIPVPKQLAQDRQSRSSETVSVPIRTIVRLADGIDRIDFSTTLVNEARDHRLRVKMGVPNGVTTVRAKEPYEVIERPAVPIPGGKDWCEPLPVATSHQQGMVAIGDAVIFSNGLPEYEALTNKEGNIDAIALTLSRGVGWLSREDLTTRKGGAGPNVPVENGQNLGEHTYEYSISMNGRKNNSQLLRMRSDFRQEIQVGPQEMHLSDILHVDGTGFEVAALAPSKDGKNAILRVYNPNDTDSTIQLSGIFKNVTKCNGLEKEIDPKNLIGEEVVLRKGEIATFKLA